VACEHPCSRCIDGARMATIDPNDSDLLANYLTEAQLAAALGVCTRTLQRWRTHRKGPPPTTDIPGRSVLYRRDGFAEWLLSHERPTERRGRRS
jgi:hypothetical protein